MLFEFFVLRMEDGFLIDCAASQAPDLAKRLSLYRLRAKVTVIALDGWVGVWPTEPDAPLRFPDPRIAAIGWRFIGANATQADAIGYDAARIALGLADSDADLGSGNYFPHEANLDQLGGVSFTKGCYVGQEVVARMEHRGTARSRILPVSLDGPAPAKGSPISSGNVQPGTLLSSAGNHALALMRLDKLADLHASPLLTETVSLRVLKPRWARYDVPGASETA
jgi:folate-binding protein YgfZ